MKKNLLILIILSIFLIGCMSINYGDEMVVVKIENSSQKGKVRYELRTSGTSDPLSSNLVIYSQPLGWNIGDIVKLKKVGNTFSTTEEQKE